MANPANPAAICSPPDATEPAVLRDSAMEPPALYDRKSQKLRSATTSIGKEFPVVCITRNRKCSAFVEECELRSLPFQTDSRATAHRVRCGLHGQGDVILRPTRE